VAGLLVRSGEILLGLRAPRLCMGGYWDLPGGKVEPGETRTEALERELREELGVEARVGPCLDVVLYDDPRDGSLWRCPVHVVRDWTGSVTINDEHDAVRWYAPPELTGVRLAHARIRRLAELALQSAHARPGMDEK
jgi:mutator protein MutT